MMSLVTFYLIFLSFHALTVVITFSQPLPYQPKDNIAIECGSSGESTAIDGRKWNGNINSKFFHIQEGQNEDSISSPAVEKPTKVDSIPYLTARLSRSEFTYGIPVVPGRMFIRLYFYSSTYQQKFTNSSKVFFSVKTGHYTLLSNFSVFLTAADLGRKDLVKEFYVPVEKSVLNITFTPTFSIPDAFAFVNGIEVVSTPDDLYFWHPDDGPTYVGLQSMSALKNDTALETMYRLNVGGRDITPAIDTGFFRYWEGEGESLYLTVPGWSVIPVSTDNNLNFTAIADYFAPEAVYRTARSMGMNEEINKKYNLTWEFEVDSGFQYMVRLHFCEIQKEINSTGGRVFLIFIANQIADDHADVIYWTGGQFVPYFRDYVVYMTSKEGEKKLNLSLVLVANEKKWRTYYVDAILNGVEIFKLKNSDFIGNTLEGPNLHLMLSKGENNQTLIIGIVSGVIFSGVILSILGFVILRRWRKLKDSCSSERTTWWGLIFCSTAKLLEMRATPLSSDLCRYFSLAEIKAATNNFNDNFIIGVGGFGNVYKGQFDGGATVAIKRLKPESSQGAHEFKTEIEMLSHLRHLNLVSLIGYCNENREMILVYEYMPRGTLSNHLYNTENPPLPWIKRLEICIGAASGLHYLHAGVKHMIIHRDVKTTNILLDERWVAKVSDFGLSKLGPTGLSTTHVSTMVKGSIGYLDPEYYRLHQLTEKSDVYSFGVVLCEVLCGRPPIMRTVERRQMSLAEWVRSCHQDGTLGQIVDPYLTGKIVPQCLNKYGEVAVSCMLDNGAERPSMKEVVWGLESALQLQKKAEEDIRLGGQYAESNHNGALGTGCSWEDPSGAIFSDINALQAR